MGEAVGAHGLHTTPYEPWCISLGSGARTFDRAMRALRDLQFRYSIDKSPQSLRQMFKIFARKRQMIGFAQINYKDSRVIEDCVQGTSVGFSFEYFIYSVPVRTVSY